MDTLVFSAEQAIFQVRHERILDYLELRNLRRARRHILHSIGGLETEAWAIVLSVGLLASLWFSMDWATLALGSALLLLAGIYAAEVIFPKIPGLLADLRNRRKEVIAGEIKKLNLLSDGREQRYFVVLRGTGGEKIFVPEGDWRMLKTGDRVEIHRALRSKVVLKIVHLTSEQSGKLEG